MEPRHEEEYSDRKVEAARRALIDIMQVPELAEAWKHRIQENMAEVRLATEYLRDKFASVDDYGPQQVVEFHNSINSEERDIQARRAYELVRTFLEKVET